MKFITSKDAFIKVLGVCQEVINSKSPISILSNVYLETNDDYVVVKCTNSAVSAKTKFNAEIIEKGNTPEMLEKVHKKYTELWLFQLSFTVESLPRVIRVLLYYPISAE